MTAVATILAIGDELMLGDRVDTNGPWLSRALSGYGIETIERRTTHDDVEMIALAIKQLTAKCDILVMSGGLGPTEDDRTREALAFAMGEQLTKDDDALASMTAWFASRNAPMPPQNEVQALRPPSARWLQNEHGTAPGLLANFNACKVLCLPGPPTELQPMFLHVHEELVSGLAIGNQTSTTEIHAWGIPESVAGDKIADLMHTKEPTVSILMSDQSVTARVTSPDTTVNAKIVDEIEKRWSPWVFGRDAYTLAHGVGELLKDRTGSLATAESCTGGLLSEMAVNESGASDWFRGGWVTYSNALKVSQLGVQRELIEVHGAVSCEVAAAMCRGAREKSGATVALSTTGIAGPDGGCKEKPVGCVYIGCEIEGEVEVCLFHFSGNRTHIRIRTANSAMQMLRLRLLGELPSSMCWQQGEAIHC